MNEKKTEDLLCNIVSGTFKHVIYEIYNKRTVYEVILHNGLRFTFTRYDYRTLNLAMEFGNGFHIVSRPEVDPPEHSHDHRVNHYLRWIHKNIYNHTDCENVQEAIDELLDYFKVSDE